MVEKLFEMIPYMQTDDARAALFVALILESDGGDMKTAAKVAKFIQTIEDWSEIKK